MTISKLSKNAFALLFGYLFTWFLLYSFVPNYISSEYKPISFSDLFKAHKYTLNIIHDKYFGVTSVGIFIRFFIEILITSLFFYMGCLLSNVKIKFRLIMTIVTVAHTVFIVQFLSEFLYMKIYWAEIRGIRKDDISLFSISYFLSLFKINYEKAFDYAFQTLGIFEICYWYILVTLFVKTITTDFLTGIKIVFGYYVFPLFIWLLLVTFVSLI